MIRSMDENAANYRRLDSKKLIETVQVLHRRIETRFPGAGLGKIAAELLEVAEETVARTEWIQRPHLLLRLAAAVLILLMIAVVVGLLVNIHQFEIRDFGSFIQAFDASIGSVVFMGAAMLFLVSWENRIKRHRALKAIHELRALAHIVDMHQLTKDPENYFGRGRRPMSTPKRDMTPFELNRYFDYCNDFLALVSKIAALYVQDFQDPVLLDAVDDVEDLTSGLSRKIFQKISLLDNLTRMIPEEGASEPDP